MPIIVPTALAAVPELPETPHFAWPFTFNAAGAQVNEQDSLDDVFDCTQAIVACPVGARSDLPGFGIPNPLFAQAPLDTSGIARSLTYWEPRASVAAREFPDLVNEATRRVQINVSTAQADR